MKIREPILFSAFKIFLKNIPELWYCKKCFSFFTQNIIYEKDAIDLYSKNKTNKWHAEKFELEKTKDLVLEVNKYLFKGASVLDIGCNTGELLDFCKKNGAKTAGVEYSELCRKICTEKGHEMYFSLEKIEKEKKYDVIFAFDIVEHSYDIKSFFNEIKIKLKKDGVVIILTGNPNYHLAKILKEKWWYFVLPEHIIFPSETYFTSLANFKLISYVPIYNSMRYYKNSLFHVDFNILFKLKIILRSLLSGYYEYNFPLLGPDHALIIIKNNEI